MTREEEKNKARFEYVSKRLANPDFPTYNAEYELEAAFDEGIEWADSHPHWISVEDELPEKGDIVIVMQDAYGNIHFTACEFISAMQLCDVTDFHVRSDAYLGITKKAEITLGAVTHWMPLPLPPAKLSNVERTGKNWKE